MWSDVDLGVKLFDFILCSHVLYYIREDEWIDAIDKMCFHLAEGGRIGIVLQSPIGEVAGFFNQFTHYDVNVLELWRMLVKKYGDDTMANS